MNWDNLANDRCPRCNSKLESHGMLADFVSCTGSHCLFKINQDKFLQLKGKIINRRETSYDPDVNLAALNNL